MNKSLEKNAEHYTMMIDSLPVGICIIQKGQFKHVNKALLDMFYHEKPDVFIGKKIWDVALQEDRSLVKSKFFKYGQTHSLPDHFTFGLRKKMVQLSG